MSSYMEKAISRMTREQLERQLLSMLRRQREDEVSRPRKEAAIPLQVIVSEPTPDALAYAHALEQRGAYIMQDDDEYHGEPYVLTRPHDGSLYNIFPPHLDAEALHPTNIGRMVAGLLPYDVPPICQAVGEWLESLKEDDEDDIADLVHVVGHGLGSIIAAYLARRGLNSVTHTRTAWAAEYMDLPTVNASRLELPGERVLQLILNPPEFSRRLVDLVIERAVEIATEEPS